MVLEQNLVKRVPADADGEGGEAVRFLPHRRGQSLAEYTVILVLASIIVIAILFLLGPAIGNALSQIIQIL